MRAGSLYTSRVRSTSNVDNVAKIQKHRRDITEGIADSLRSFVHALHNAGGDGRYPTKIRQALQVISASVSRAVALAPAAITIQEVGDALGLNPRSISESKARFNALSDGEWEEIFDDRSNVRNDMMNEEWVEFASEYWSEPELVDENNEAYTFTRRSESMSQVVRDPTDRTNKVYHRVHWLEERISVMYQAMLSRGMQRFGDDFHMSWPYFLGLRPYYVKDATRQTCMCVYHMRFDEVANGLLNYRRSLQKQEMVKCSCYIPANTRELRKMLICSAHEDHVASSLDNIECIMQRCEDCKGLQRLFASNVKGSMCADEMNDPGEGTLGLQVHFESFQKIFYTTKDGTEKVDLSPVLPYSTRDATFVRHHICMQVKKDFVSTQMPFSKFRQHLDEYWPKFIAHHNDAKWHDDDFVALKTNLRRGHVAFVIDFAENYSHEPRFEHQSKYFSQVHTTVLPVVIMCRVEDLTNISNAEKEDLLQMFNELNIPPVISETHFVLSSDMNHDNPFVQKALDDHIVPYMLGATEKTEFIHVRSDGCKVFLPYKLKYIHAHIQWRTIMSLISSSTQHALSPMTISHTLITLSRHSSSVLPTFIGYLANPQRVAGVESIGRFLNRAMGSAIVIPREVL